MFKFLLSYGYCLTNNGQTSPFVLLLLFDNTQTITIVLLFDKSETNSKSETKSEIRKKSETKSKIRDRSETNSKLKRQIGDKHKIRDKLGIRNYLTSVKADKQMTWYYYAIHFHRKVKCMKIKTT